ncbi:MAG TPA: glycosyltransferase family 1 protein [Gammaproteobacteria bacterium]|nr:glycosyltransferase family 1 protein [Gammaproteobacteria bacterium]
MKIVIATDAWHPQINGVVTTLTRTGEVLRQQGHEILYITPEPFRTVSLPTYKEIRLAILPGRKIRRILGEFHADAIHIATEGPVGLAVRAYCLRNKLPFTSSYHTQFPEYIRLRFPIPLAVCYRLLRWFHSPAVRTMVPTESQRKKLEAWNFNNLIIWARGVDTEIFKPYECEVVSMERLTFIYVGRVAVEKNLDSFLSLELPGTKIVVGDGPDMSKLRGRYPDVVFTGYKFGEELARFIAAADVFVFPSRTDTFGLVMLEAMACGVPVAAYPVTGPVDVIKNGETGILDEDLGKATMEALKLDRSKPRDYALQHSWLKSTEHFIDNLAPRATNQY